MVKTSIYFPLTIMLILTLLATLFGTEFSVYTEPYDVVGDQIVDGTTQTYGLDFTFNFGITESQGAITIIIALISVAIILGINVLGSGLNERSVKILSTIIIYAGIWAFLSLYAYEMLITIELLGSLLYLILTFIYVFGIIHKITN